MTNDPVLDLARRQFGVVSHRQLIDVVGLDGATVTALASSDQLVHPLPTVYRLASAPDTFLARAFAVQLWADGDGFLSSSTAARIRGLRQMPADPIHLTFTAPHRFTESVPSWVRLHRGDDDADREHHELSTGLVVSSPLRMVFEIARDLTLHRFGRAADDAWQLGLTNPAEMRSSLEHYRHLGEEAVTTVEHWCTLAAHRSRPTDSNLERDLIVALRRVGLPPASRHHPLRLASGEMIDLDIAWPAVRLAIEPGDPWSSGGSTHDAPHHERDVACGAAGWTVIRLDEAHRLDPHGAARRIHDAYRARWRELSGQRPLAPSDDAA